MATFTKAQAMNLLGQADGNTEHFELGDEQRTYVASILKLFSYSQSYMSGTGITGITQGSITISWDREDEGYAIKTGLGDGINTGSQLGGTHGHVALATSADATTGIAKPAADGETPAVTMDGLNHKFNTGFHQKTYYFSHSLVRAGGFQYQDLQQGMPNAVAVKYAWAVALFEKLKEKNFMIAMASKVDSTATSIAEVAVIGDPAGLTGWDKVVEMKNKIVNAAIELERKEDPLNGILNGFDQDTMFIDLDPTVFNMLVDSRLVEDKGMAAFENGYFMVGMLGGFRIRANKYIKNLSTGGADTTKARILGFVATNRTAVSLLKIMAMNAGKLAGLSNDEGFYVEVQVLGAQDRTPIWFDTVIPGSLIALTDKAPAA